MAEPGRFHDATLVRIRQPYRSGGAALPIAHEKGRDLWLWCEFCLRAFPSPVRDACGPRGSSEYTQRAGVSGGAFVNCDDVIQEIPGGPRPPKPPRLPSANGPPTTGRPGPRPAVARL